MNLSRRSFTKLGAAAAIKSSALAKGLSEVDAPPPLWGELTADMSTRSAPFNRMIFGGFLEHFHREVYGGVFDPGSPLADKEGFRLDVIEALRELKVPVVRWPGGCFASAYHWRDGVGKNRQPSFNLAWGVQDSNTFGTDEYIQWCRRIEAEPYICTNAGTGTPEEMSDWVEYCNLPDQGRNAQMRIANGSSQPYNVRYWSIGNENYFSTEIGSKTIEQWIPFVRESEQLMRAVVSNIQLLAAATVSGNWTKLMLQNAGKPLDYISIHGYWDPLWAAGTTPKDYSQCMAVIEAPEKQIAQAIELLTQSGFGDRIKIAFDEWNLRSWHHPGFPGGGANHADWIRDRDENDRNDTFTMADAVFSASFLNGCIRHSKYVQMACISPIVNVRGPLYVHPKGVVRRTTFHAIKMYSNLLQPNLVGSQVVGEPLNIGQVSVPALDAVTTCSEDKKRVAIALVNRDPERSARWKLNLRNSRWRPEGRITILSGDSTDAYNDVLRPNRVVPQTASFRTDSGALAVPAHSVAIAELSA